MIKVSKVDKKVNCEVKSFDFNSLHNFIKQNDWSPFIFEKNYRRKENFISTDIIVADIDTSLSLEQALVRLNERNLAYSITFSKSHKKDKNGKTCDRFRLVLPLENTIILPDKYILAWRKLEAIFPEMDIACKDMGRFYYASNGEDVIYPEGLLKLEGFPFSIPDKFVSKETLYFMENAYTGFPGEWNSRLNKVAFDMGQNGLSLEETISEISSVAPNILDEKDRNTILSGHNSGTKNKKEERAIEVPFSFWSEIETNDKLRIIFEKSNDIFSLINILHIQNYTAKEAVAIALKTQRGKEEGLKYCEKAVLEVYNNPPKVGSDNYEEYIAIANSQLIKKQKQELIFEYKLNKEHERTLKLIEADKRKGIYSLLNTSELRKDKYLSDINAMRDAISKRLFCITEELTHLIPLFGVEIILMAAETGRGKTSFFVNVVEPLIEQGKKVLCITNEERGSDIAMRIAALKLGLNVNNRGLWKADSEEWVNLTKECEKLTKNENIHIVDNYVSGRDLKTGDTVDPLDLTNIDHIKALLTSVERDGFKFDLMLFDYITKVGSSDAKDVTHKVIVDTIKYVEEWAKRNGCPCIIFSQLKPQPKDAKPLEYSDRLPASKQMLHAFSTALEIDTNYDKKETTIIARKVRYGEQFQKTLKFVNGRYKDELEK